MIEVRCVFHCSNRYLNSTFTLKEHDESWILLTNVSLYLSLYIYVCVYQGTYSMAWIIFGDNPNCVIMPDIVLILDMCTTMLYTKKKVKFSNSIKQKSNRI